eukprot:TRINITY_DN16027_c0_g1_i1.p1 TRINITY_DN16027_c0_g1~~TRINITY_DN16027_c0_g1_i1.p1  ORF type:complete len:749 (+),score=218.82 TRINITY_DN16027_c0_g1_i1:773-3019(+)
MLQEHSTMQGRLSFQEFVAMFCTSKTFKFKTSPELAKAVLRVLGEPQRLRRQAASVHREMLSSQAQCTHLQSLLDAEAAKSVEADARAGLLQRQLKARIEREESIRACSDGTARAAKQEELSRRLTQLATTDLTVEECLQHERSAREDAVGLVEQLTNELEAEALDKDELQSSFEGMLEEAAHALEARAKQAEDTEALLQAQVEQERQQRAEVTAVVEGETAARLEAEEAMAEMAKALEAEAKQLEVQLEAEAQHLAQVQASLEAEVLARERAEGCVSDIEGKLEALEGEHAMLLDSVATEVATSQLNEEEIARLKRQLDDRMQEKAQLRQRVEHESTARSMAEEARQELGQRLFTQSEQLLALQQAITEETSARERADRMVTQLMGQLEEEALAKAQQQESIDREAEAWRRTEEAMCNMAEQLRVVEGEKQRVQQRLEVEMSVRYNSEKRAKQLEQQMQAQTELAERAEQLVESERAARMSQMETHRQSEAEAVAFVAELNANAARQIEQLQNELTDSEQQVAKLSSEMAYLEVTTDAAVSDSDAAKRVQSTSEQKVSALNAELSLLREELANTQREEAASRSESRRLHAMLKALQAGLPLAESEALQGLEEAQISDSSQLYTLSRTIASSCSGSLSHRTALPRPDKVEPFIEMLPAHNLISPEINRSDLVPPTSSPPNPIASDVVLWDNTPCESWSKKREVTLASIAELDARLEALEPLSRQVSRLQKRVEASRENNAQAHKLKCS